MSLEQTVSAPTVTQLAAQFEQYTKLIAEAKTEFETLIVALEGKRQEIIRITAACDADVAQKTSVFESQVRILKEERALIHTSSLQSQKDIQALTQIKKELEDLKTEIQAKRDVLISEVQENKRFLLDIDKAIDELSANSKKFCQEKNEANESARIRNDNLNARELVVSTKEIDLAHQGNQNTAEAARLRANASDMLNKMAIVDEHLADAKEILASSNTTVEIVNNRNAESLKRELASKERTVFLDNKEKNLISYKEQLLILQGEVKQFAEKAKAPYKDIIL